MSCLYQEREGGGGITGIVFCHQITGPITGWAYKREFTVFIIHGPSIATTNRARKRT